MNIIYDVCIIGSGFSGLMTGYNLKQKNKKILILEANDYIGGRIKNYNYNSSNYNQGASFIHGDENSEFYKFCREKVDLEMNLIEKYFYYDPNQNLIYPEEQILHNNDKKEINKFINCLKSHNYNNHNNLSISEFLKRYFNFQDKRSLPFLKSKFGYDYGVSADNLNFNDINKLDSNWEFGEKEYKVKNFNNLIDFISNKLTIKKNVLVNSIEKDDQSKILSIKSKNKTFKAKTVLVTVPIPNLHSIKNISHLININDIKISKIVTVILFFSQKPWKDNYDNSIIYCDPNCQIPVLDLWTNNSKNEYVCYCFIPDDKAKNLMLMDKEKRILKILEQLDKMFNNLPSKSLEDFVIEDWGSNPNIPLGYTIPSDKFHIEKKKKKNLIFSLPEKGLHLIVL